MSAVRPPYWDVAVGAHVQALVLGEWLVGTRNDLVFTTTLGSCVAACVFDPIAGVGGINHFLLPETVGSDKLSASARYGAAAMETLINAVLKVTKRRDRLRSKVFGGASLGVGGEGIGLRNVEFAMGYLAEEGIPTMIWDVGGDQARAVRFWPATGRSQRRLIGMTEGLRRVEAKFLDNLRHQPVEGDVELF